MNELSLFTGAGGGVLASKLLGWRTVGYVEFEPYCQAVIRQRQIDGIYDEAPIFSDVRQFDGKPWRGVVDIITAGFPCQPFSVAGKRAGEDDPRNMWPETLRIISEVRPRYAFLENVPGLISAGYLGTILSGLAESGYDAEWCVLGADDVGAPHRRKRLWILAYTNKGWELQSQRCLSDERGRVGNGGEGRITWWDTDPADIPDPDQRGLQAQGAEQQTTGTTGTDTHTRTDGPAQPRLGRVAHGVAHRVDRLKAIGNGQVPAVAVAAWQELRGRICEL